MRFSDFMKMWLYQYFIIVAGFFFFRAVLGVIYYPEYVLTNRDVLLTFPVAAVMGLPTFLFFSRKDLNTRQTILRWLLHFLLLETVVLGMGAYGAWFNGVAEGVVLGAFVALVYLVVVGVSWLINVKTANDINRKIAELE